MNLHPAQAMSRDRLPGFSCEIPLAASEGKEIAVSFRKTGINREE